MRSLQIRTCQGFSDVHSVNITALAGSPSVVPLARIHQIFTIPQTQLLVWVNRIRTGEQQNKLPGIPCISGNSGILSIVRYHKLILRQKNMIRSGNYDNINYSLMVATAPVRPVGTASRVTSHVSGPMNQFNGSQTSARANVKPAKLVILCAKTHRRGSQFVPASCELKRW